MSGAPLTPQQFVAKWRGVRQCERAVAPQHFLDLCPLFGKPAPATADPIGAWFTFEKGVTKTSGGRPVAPPAAGTPVATATPGRGNCSPAYPTVCIPPLPPDLDCGDISFRNFQVLSPDPHRFDSDNDGIGCETYTLHRPRRYT